MKHMRVADVLWPDGMDMVDPASGHGRWTTVSWCAGLVVVLHEEQEAAAAALAAIDRTGCGHGCWRDHELVDTEAPPAIDAVVERRRMELRVAHFTGCRTCHDVFSGQAVAAARNRHRTRLERH